MNTKKRFRLFISSTFNDFKREREILQTEIFPEIEQHCIEKGFIFQPIDLRWGVSSEAQLDQKTLELCLNEVRSCKSHPHPNFIVMLGDRYGWIPLPYCIEKSEFETLSAKANCHEQNELKQLTKWYLLNNNQLPASYILRERDGKYIHSKQWEPIENELRQFLQKLVERSDIEDKKPYFTSATEAEIDEGISEYLEITQQQKPNDGEHIFGFFRTVEPTSKNGALFIESDEDFEKANNLKEKVKEIIPAANRLSITTQHDDETTLKENYLEAFKTDITKFLRTQIDQSQHEQEVLTPLERELKEQEFFAQNKRHGFVGQEDLLNTIQNYINNNSPNETQDGALVVYGASGMGKSSLMAKAIEQVQQNTKRKVLYRFVGATPHSSLSVEVLSSIFEQLGIIIKLEQPSQDSARKNIGNNEPNKLDLFYSQIYDAILNIKEPCVICIDAVDQFISNDAFSWLPQKLPNTVKIVISALNDAHYEDDSRYFKVLKNKTSNCHEIKPFTEKNALALLNGILKEQNRTLQKEQKDYFLQQFQSSPTPLYALIASHELKTWKSDDRVADSNNTQGKTLATTQQGIIKEFINNLHQIHHHHKDFVSRVLGYLFASKDGLSEHELLDLLATDEAFITELASEKFHENKNKKMPLVYWSRLQAVLEPFLSIKNQDGEELMSFFHREFSDVIKRLPNQQILHKKIIDAAYNLIKILQDEPFQSNRLGKLFISLIIQGDNNKNILLLKDIHLTWVESFVRCLSDIANSTAIGTSTSYTMKMLKAAYILTFELKNKDSMELLYINSTIELAVHRKRLNLFEDANKLYEEIHFIISKRYDENYSDNASTYTKFLIAYAINLKHIGKNQAALLLLQDACEISEKEHKLQPTIETWTEFYDVATYNKALLTPEPGERLSLLEEVYELSKKKYMDKKNNRNGLSFCENTSALALELKKMDQINKAKTRTKEAYDLSHKLFESDKNLWVHAYVTAIERLANFEQLENSRLLLERARLLIKEYYSVEKNMWGDKYASICNNLARQYFDINTDRSLSLFVKAYEIRKKQYSEFRTEENEEKYYLVLSNTIFIHLKLNKINRIKEFYNQVLTYYKNQSKEPPIEQKKIMEVCWREYYDKNSDIDLDSLASQLKEFGAIS